MAALAENDDAEGWEFVQRGSLGKVATGPEVTPKKGKFGLRNEKRRARKLEAKAAEDAEAARVQSILAGQVVAAEEESACPGLTRALQESLALSGNGASNGSATETPEQSRQRRLKAAKKRQKQIDSIALQPPESLDADQKAKLARRNEIEEEISSLETEIAVEAEAQRAREEAAALLHAENMRRLAESTSKVQYDDTFECPICTEPLEAATLALPCRHVFCRACLEHAMTRAATASRGDPRACVCPLCRACLFDPKVGKLTTEPAKALRKRLAAKKGTCECGLVVPLSSLRQHLRTCEQVAPLAKSLDQRPTFSGHEFLQPQLDQELCLSLASELKQARKDSNKVAARKATQAKQKQGSGSGNNSPGGGSPGNNNSSRSSRSSNTTSANTDGNGSPNGGRASGGAAAVRAPEGYDEGTAAQAAILATMEWCEKEESVGEYPNIPEGRTRALPETAEALIGESRA